ncbi:MAG: NTP transferase domain-containing protein [Candidatus Hydrogenedentes bacterium]|nr:NTP transferase domain-containing protein [Candidatus Hydrogenedentota bacterium]
MNCSHKTQARGIYAFTYNPFEIAICGPSPINRSALAARATALLAENYKTAQVMRRESSGNEDDKFPLGVNLVTGDGQQGLLYPSEMDEYLSPRPLLDVDVVLIESEADTSLPKLVWVESGETPEYTNVIAFTHASASHPILSSDAIAVPDNQPQRLRTILDDHFRGQVESIPLYGLVLAGGHSTRMESDKGLLDYRGVPQVQYCHDLLAGYCDAVFISLRAEQGDIKEYQRFHQIPDAFLGFGPLGGILSAQKAHPNAAWLVTACDLPYVSGRTVEQLIEQRNPFKLATAFVSVHDGFPEPLFAIYEPKSVFRLSSFLTVGYHCPRKVLINSDTWLLTPEDPRALENVNVPQEREVALKALAGESVPTR